MTLERRQYVAEFFESLDEGLTRLVRVSHGDKLAAATRASSALAELAREFSDDSRLAWLLKPVRDRPRGLPFACKFSDAQFEAALLAAGQRVAAAAAALGCDRSVIYRWRERKSRATARITLQASVALVSDRRH